MRRKTRLTGLLAGMLLFALIFAWERYTAPPRVPLEPIVNVKQMSTETIDLQGNPYGETPANDNAPRLSTKREKYILYGNNSGGGGHLAGTGQACKSEFPPNWNAEKVIRVTKRVAANDNLNWVQESNGYYVADQMVEGVKVHVVLDKERDDIITSYPTNRPLNPCPSRH